MKSFHITPGALKGNLFIPPSKSHTLRAILFGAMAHGRSEILHPLPSPDAEAMIRAMRIFGAEIENTREKISIVGLQGKLSAAEDVIDAGNSGLVLRLVGALAGLSPTYTVITGDASIRHSRPVKPLLEGLSQLGAFATSTRGDDHAPLIIRGLMAPGKATLSGEDSQPVSGLLIATSFLQGKSELTVTSPGEKPWIDLTLYWLKRFGIDVQNENYTHYKVAGDAHIEGFHYAVPGDFSSAAFPLAAALITRSELTLSNLDMDDCQGDKQLIPLLQKMGASIDIDPARKTLTVRRGSRLQGCRIDVNDFIDAIPILSVLGCYAAGKTEILGGKIARNKESDRIHAMATELKKMGAKIEEKSDGLCIEQSPLSGGASLSSWNDHRVAMALAVAGLGAEGKTRVESVECIAKTYPSFCSDLQRAGASIEEER